MSLRRKRNRSRIHSIQPDTSAVKSVNIIAIARDIVALEARMNGARIAEHYGKSRAWVTKTRKLLKLPPRVIALIEAGRLSGGAGEALIGASEAFVEAVAARVEGGERISGRDMVRLVREHGAGSTARDAALPPKQIRAFWRSVRDDEAAPAELRELAELTLRWLAGHKPDAEFRTDLAQWQLKR